MRMMVTVQGGQTYEMTEQMMVGRDDGCAIRLEDPHVSRKHAVIQRCPQGSFLLVDLGSALGVEVDGQRIRCAVLRPGTQVDIGGCRLKFHTTDARAATQLVESEEGAIQSRMAIETDRRFESGSNLGADYDLRRDYEQLRAAYELTRRIGTERDELQMMSRILDAAFDLLPAERAAVLLIDQETGEPRCELGGARSGAAVAVSVSKTILAEVVQSKSGLITADAGADARFSRSQSVFVDGVRSAMCVPILQDDEVLGVLHADTLCTANAFQEEDLRLFSVIATQAGLALKTAMLMGVVKKEQHRLQSLIEALPSAVLVFDAAGGQAAVNRAGEAFLAAVGPVEPAELEARSANGPFEMEAEGRTFAVAGTHADGRFVLAAQDVTEQRRRLQQSAHADRLSLVGQLAGGVSHDLNNLLGIVLGQAEMIQEETADETVRSYAQDVVEAAQRCVTVSRQLVAFSRKGKASPQRLDVNAVIAAAEPMFQGALRSSVELAFEAGAELPQAEMDPVRLEQVLLNLVINARDASEAGSKIRLSTSVVRLPRTAVLGSEQLPAGRYVQISVADQGCGMPPEVAARVFEPFFTTKPHNEGTGLGLAMVHGLVKQAGGWVWVESKPGAGSVFTVCLPALDGQDRTATSADSACSAA